MAILLEWGISQWPLYWNGISVNGHFTGMGNQAMAIKPLKTKKSSVKKLKGGGRLLVGEMNEPQVIPMCQSPQYIVFLRIYKYEIDMWVFFAERYVNR